jgi:hypothetical protein
MARRIIDYLGKRTGRHVKLYVWRSRPVKSPLTGSPICAVVAKDEHDMYWPAFRVGNSGYTKRVRPHYEFWAEGFNRISPAIWAAREFAGTLLMLHADEADYLRKHGAYATVGSMERGSKSGQTKIWFIHLSKP